jgi:hypothetical protein
MKFLVKSITRLWPLLVFSQNIILSLFGPPFCHYFLTAFTIFVSHKISQITHIKSDGFAGYRENGHHPQCMIDCASIYHFFELILTIFGDQCDKNVANL